MFDGFKKTRDTEARKRFALSTGASFAVYALVGIGAAYMAGATTTSKVEEKIDVIFKPPPEAPPPKPPPPPPPLPKKRITAPPSPVASALPPPPEMVAPKEIKDVKHKESDAPSTSAPPPGPPGGKYGPPGSRGPAKPADDEGEDEPPKPAPTVQKHEPINLPEDAEPAEPDEGNENPEYPDDLKAEGATAVIILKIAINEKGNVDRVSVMQGKEPFTKLAVDAIKKWHYTPAAIDGKPIFVWKIVKITFKP